MVAFGKLLGDLDCRGTVDTQDPGANQSHFLLCPKMGCEVAPENVLFGKSLQYNTEKHRFVYPSQNFNCVNCTISESIYENGS